MQVELFNRRKRKTRIELASAIHDYIELFHNTHRRHSALDMLTPFDVEAAWGPKVATRDSRWRGCRRPWGRPPSPGAPGLATWMVSPMFPGLVGMALGL
jgi:hypothetical protein